MGLKGIGNIGAHPEREINLIIDVDKGEVDSLIELLLVLDKDWYASRADRAVRLATEKAIASAKAMAKNPGVVAATALAGTAFRGLSTSGCSLIGG